MRRITALAFLLLALASTALAAEPPPRDPIVVLAVVVNGRPVDSGARFVWRNGQPHATLAQWRQLGLRGPDGPGTETDPERLVSAQDWPGVRLRVDERSQALIVEQSIDPLHQVFGATSDGDLPERSQPGAALDYDLVVQRHPGHPLQRAALLGARVFAPWGSIEQGAVLSDGPLRRRVRLDTTFTQVDPSALRRLRVGDFVGGALSWTRPVRMAGVQVMTDFSLRPDLLTLPTPLVTGQASVPSTVDLLVNGVLRLSQPVEPGSFEIRQVPVVSGLGDIAVVVRDVLGRETVQSLPFYASVRQLAPGRTAWSLQTGRVRRLYGFESNHYGPWATSASWQRGLDASNTVELHGEFTRGAALAAAGLVHQLPAFGVLDAHGALGRGGNWLVGAGFERYTRGVSVGLAWESASEAFRDIAGAQSDARAQHSLRARAGAQLGRAGSIGMAYADLRGGPNPARLASASWSFSPGARIQAHLSTYRNLHTGDHGMGVFLSLPLGAHAHGATGVRRDRQATTISTQASNGAWRSNEWEWRVQRDQAVDDTAQERQSAQLGYRGSAGFVEAAVERVNGHNAIRAGARGALVLLAGSLHPVAPVTGGMALVEVPGVPGVGVYRENRIAGRTDASGRLLLADLVPWMPNTIAIEPLDLPPQVEIGAPSLSVRPPDRGGVHLRFNVFRPSAGLLVLQDARGLPLPLGALVRRPGAEPATVGHDGEAWVRGLVQGENPLEVVWQGRRLCSLRLRIDSPHPGRIGPLRCAD